MAQNAPVLIGVPDPYDTSTASPGYFEYYNEPRGPRILSFDGDLYAVYFFVDSGNYNLRVSKSTDDGDTWTNVDTANEPTIQAVASLDLNSHKAFIQGDKLWVVLSHDSVSGSDHTYEVRMFTFNLTTELWVAGYVAGPSETYIGTTGVIFNDACLRGTDEVVVLWEANVSPSTAKAFIDIYNTTSATWTSTNISVFDGTGSYPPAPGDTIAWDGSYIHIFSQLWFDSGYPPGTDYVRLHRTMDASNTLDAEYDLMTVLDAAWLPATFNSDSNACYSTSFFSQIHNGKIYIIQDARVSMPFNTDNRQVICFYADTGTPTPTWTAEGVYLPLDSSSEYAFWAALFVSNGTLHCAFLYTEDFNSIFIYTTKRVAGTWTTPVEFYGYDANPPYFGGVTAPGSGLNIRNFAVIPDTFSESRFSMMATLNYDFQNSVWFLSDDPCNCPSTSSNNVMFFGVVGM